MKQFTHKHLENQKLPQFFILHFLYLRKKLKNENLNFRAIFGIFNLISHFDTKSKMLIFATISQKSIFQFNRKIELNFDTRTIDSNCKSNLITCGVNDMLTCQSPVEASYYVPTTTHCAFIVAMRSKCL